LVVVCAIAVGTSTEAEQPPAATDRADLGDEPAATPPPQKPQRHLWERIAYPQIPDPDSDGQTFSVMVSSGERDDQPQLRLYVIQSGPVAPTFLDSADKPIVRLHMPDDEVVDPQADTRRWVGVGSSPAFTWNRIIEFPWGRSFLEEAWFELRTTGPTIWVEVPYGFTRNPADPLAPPLPDNNGPRFAPAMAEMADGDRIVTWDSVKYKVVKNARRLTVYQSNSTDAECRLRLSKVPDLPGLLSSVEVEQNADHRVAGSCRNETYDQMNSSRLGTFNFNRNPTHGRDWGHLKVIAEDTCYSIVMPSSLFRHAHGVADPRHKALVRPASHLRASPPFKDVEAIEIATAALSEKFPGSYAKYKPYRAKLSNGVWHVYGTIPGGGPGGTPEARIRDADGVVIRIFHSQ